MLNKFLTTNGNDKNDLTTKKCSQVKGSIRRSNCTSRLLHLTSTVLALFIAAISSINTPHISSRYIAN